MACDLAVYSSPLASELFNSRYSQSGVNNACISKPRFQGPLFHIADCSCAGYVHPLVMAAPLILKLMVPLSS
jgi:hypothetical protein